MADQTQNFLEVTEKRPFTITLEPISLTINFFYAFVNGILVIQDDGLMKRSWSGVIPDSEVNIKVRVTGIENASFKLGIDLPGTADDQSLILNLKNGYYETEINL